jgi:RNA polymerase sigma-70 factor (ECF subfamily)
MTDPNSPHNLDRSGAQEEFLRLLLPLRDRLARYARAVSRRREEADDLVSDTILAALEGFDRLRNREAFAGYLFRIASRLQKRRRWRSKLFGAFDEDRAGAIASSSASPETTADVVLLHRALGELPAAQREAVVLFEISGLSLEEIRAIQGGSISAVKSRVSRGRQELARLLGARDDVARRTLRTEEAATAARDASARGEARFIYSGPNING